MVAMLRQALVVVACLALVVVPQCFASGISSAGLSLGAANTWTAAQTFADTCFKLRGASGTYATTIVKDGNGTQNNTLTLPSNGGDDTILTSYAQNTLNGLNIFANQANFSGNAYFFDTKLNMYNTGLTYYTTLKSPTQTANRVVTIPALTGDGTARIATATSAGTATLVAGTVTVSNTSITANSRIHLTAQNESGTAGHLGVSARSVGTSFTIKSYQGNGTAQTSDTRLVYWTSEEP